MQLDTSAAPCENLVDRQPLEKSRIFRSSQWIAEPGCHSVCFETANAVMKLCCRPSNNKRRAQALGGILRRRLHLICAYKSASIPARRDRAVAATSARAFRPPTFVSHVYGAMRVASPKAPEYPPGGRPSRIDGPMRHRTWVRFAAFHCRRSKTQIPFQPLSAVPASRMNSA